MLQTTTKHDTTVTFFHMDVTNVVQKRYIHNYHLSLGTLILPESLDQRLQQLIIQTDID